MLEKFPLYGNRQFIIEFTIYYRVHNFPPLIPSPYFIYFIIIIFFLLWRCDLTRVIVSSFLRFLDHTQRRTTVGRTPLDERSARRRDLYLTTHNTHNRQTSMPPVGFEPTISAGERPQTYATRTRFHINKRFAFVVRIVQQKQKFVLWKKCRMS